MSDIEQNKKDLISYFEKYGFKREVTFTKYIELSKTLQTGGKSVTVVIGSKDYFFVLNSEVTGSIYSKHFSLQDGTQVRFNSKMIIDLYLLIEDLF